MQARTALARLIVVSLAILATSCDPTTSPSGIGTPPSVSLAGTWTGFLGEPGSGTELRATWTASQTGSSVTGPITLVRPQASLTFGGTLAGSLTGTRLSLTFSVPRGNVPGFADCSISGNGSTNATNNGILTTLNVTYSNCQGFVVETSANATLQLTK